MLLSIALPLAASPLVTSIGEETPLGVGGGWARAASRGDGTWDFLWSAGGDYNRLVMAEDLTVEDRDRQQLTGRTDLVDHAIAPCPDGTWLHVASGNVGADNDSAWGFRYDADFQLVATATIEEQVTQRVHNDMAVICSPVAQGVTFPDRSNGRTMFFPIGADAIPDAPIALEEAPEMTGGALVWEPETDTIVALNFERGELRFARYDASLALVETWAIEPVERPLEGYWAQAVLRVGEHWLLGHMARDEGEAWAADEGDVWLQVLDLDWNVVESWPITANTPPVGGMRPGLARQGDTVLVLYDEQIQPHHVPVTIDGGAFGPDPDVEEGGGDGGPEGVPPTQGEGGCGCTSGAGEAGIAWLIGLAALARRHTLGRH